MADVDIDAVVIGGGVTGLAAAAEIAGGMRSVAVVEAHPRPGMETSTHNSGVIHAGIYYPDNSLKAALCVEGAARLYTFCAANGVPHDRCGKLIVAHDADGVAELEALQRQGSRNGVRGLRIVDGDFVRAREPHVSAAAALWSPDSGRVDASSLVLALRRTAEQRGAAMLFGRPFVSGEADGDAVTLTIGAESVRARAVVNAAGLYADDVSAALGGERFTIYPCRGEYAEVRPSRRGLVNYLVYPLPHPSGHGLGAHLMRTLGGATLIGPTIRYQARKDDYEEDLNPLERFRDSAKVMLPELELDDLRYGGSGIRAKLHPPEERFADFLIRRDRVNPSLVQAAGIDSPGLTSCLAIGARVARIVDDVLG